MQKYIVGGYVRDFLLKIPSKDRDWVVINSSREEMLSLGFKQVGADFPVFLDEIGEEYALARTERKTGNGYHGFTVNTNGVTLFDDLSRRDLTINAMAMDENNFIYDPFNGQKDLDAGILRHINADAFREDPVRVLRIARFLARWPSFSVAKETKQLCQDIVNNGEMKHLTAERITAEMMKAFNEKAPSRFFYFLRMIGALEIVFPEIHALIGVEQPYEHHPEGDAFIHTMMVLDKASWDGLGGDPLACFCALVHDLGKAVTPKEKWPHHYGHEIAGVPIVESMGARLKLPSKYIECGKMVAKYHMHIHKFHELNSKTIVKMFEDMKIKSNIELISILPFVSYCDAIGRTSFHGFKNYPNSFIAREVLAALHDVKLSHHLSEHEIKEMTVNQIKDFVYRKKLDIVSKIRQNH